MHTAFGARLRSQRELKRVSLDEISRQTKIKVSLLEALERGDLTYWPHGLFGRAYIRAYAQAVGVDAEPIVRKFLELHPDPPDELFTADAAARRGNFSALRSAVRSLPGLRRRSEETGPPPALEALANICTRLQQAEGQDDLAPILGRIAHLLNASGVVVWRWAPDARALTPWLSHGYSDQLVAQLPYVTRDDDNAIAAACRSMQVCTVAKGDHETGALVVPLVTSGTCVGALSLELRCGVTGDELGHAALIVAALLASSQFAALTPAISSQSARDDSPMNGNISRAIA